MTFDEKLLNLLPVGAENAIHCTELCDLLEADRRTVTSCISKLRQNGAVICSALDGSRGNYGYFLPKSRDELKEYVKIENLRIKTQSKALKSAKTKRLVFHYQ